jgi:hypothetical protein
LRAEQERERAVVGPVPGVPMPAAPPGPAWPTTFPPAAGVGPAGYALTGGAVVPETVPVGAWVAVVVGGLLASCGGLVLLGGLLAVALGAALPQQDRAGLLCGLVILGVAPAALGLTLFVLGVRRLTRR